MVGSNVRAIVSLCLARKYIYGREICRLSVGPLSLKTWRSVGCRNPQVRLFGSLLLQLDMGPAIVKVAGLSHVSDSYLVDGASSHMLVSKIKPCMSKYKPH